MDVQRKKEMHSISEHGKGRRREMKDHQTGKQKYDAQRQERGTERKRKHARARERKRERESERKCKSEGVKVSETEGVGVRVTERATALESREREICKQKRAVYAF